MGPEKVKGIAKGLSHMTIRILGFSATLPSKFNLFNQWMNPMEQETCCVGRWIWNFLPTMQGIVYRDSLKKDPKWVHLFPKSHQLGLLEFILFLFILIFFSFPSSFVVIFHPLPYFLFPWIVNCMLLCCTLFTFFFMVPYLPFCCVCYFARERREE